MKEGVVIFALTLVSSVLSAQVNPVQKSMSRSEYIAAYKDIAIKQMVESGIPASITLAQGCLESGNGNSILAREANNHFGIKCHDWQGESIQIDDDRKGECFRKYESVEESFQDHSNFLKDKPRYASLFALERNDYKGWAYGLKAAGYATASDYAQRLIKIIEENGLAIYDSAEGVGNEVTGTSVGKKAERQTRAGGKSIGSGEKATGAGEKGAMASPYRISTERDIHKDHGREYIIANGYDTYSSLAKEYRMFRRELMRFNGAISSTKESKASRANGNDPIPAGSKVYLEKRR